MHRLSLVAASEGGSPVAVCRLLIAMASVTPEREPYTRGCGLKLPHDMWDLPPRGIEFVFLALEGDS